MAELVDLPAGRQARTTQNRMEMKVFFIYVLKSKIAKYLYVGLTDNIERRFKQHNDGRCRSTKHYYPFDIILIEEFATRPEARRREIYLKSGIGKEYLKTLL